MAFASARSRRDDREFAASPAISPSDLVALAARGDRSTKAVIAARADCPLATMITFALEHDAAVHAALLANPAVPETVLAHLAQSRHGKVRAGARARLGSAAA